MRTCPNNSGHMIVPTMIVVLLLSSLVGVAVLFTQHAGRQARDSRELTNAISSLTANSIACTTCGGGR